jgi:hypothetical protein
VIAACAVAAALQVAGPPDSLAGSYRDSAARVTLARARSARASQDSALIAYDARSYQRVAVGFNPGGFGRDRMLFGYESVGRVRWQRGRGAQIEMLGARVRGVVNDLTPPVPYSPGLEPLWIKGGPVEEALEPVALRHPLALGAETLYTYSSGDSVTIELNDGTTVRIYELRVRPRRVDPYLVVGSFWFDAASGQLVRASYRPSVALDLLLALKNSPDSATRAENSGVGAMIGRFIAEPASIRVSTISVEYSLHDGRFWLPRSRGLDATMQASIMTGSVRVDQRFTYASVNGRDTIPVVIIRAGAVDSDTLTGKAKEDAVAGLRPDSAAECQRGDSYTVTSKRDGTPVAMRVPCDRSKLSQSAELPTTIFTAVDEADAAEREAMIERAISLRSQAPIALGRLPRPSLGYGLNWMRFNRVEGVSVGAQIDQRLGAGFTARGLARYGFGDRTPNLELGLSRSDLSDSVELRGYTRLVASNDWGQPLGLTSSLVAALTARDAGFYYRANGVELSGGQAAAFGRSAHVAWRVFAEQHDSATVTQARTLGGKRFAPNVSAMRGTWSGGALRIHRTLGIDPSRVSLLTDVRLEAATGETDYGRVSLDATASRPFGRYAGALTLAGGTSLGVLPPQRHWFLGGPHTVRGQVADTSTSGNAFWLVRAEVAPNSPVRLSLFADIGWVGDRTRVRDGGRPMSGAGIGLSLFDGLARIDFARGIHPRERWRVEMYLGGRY